MSKTWIQTNQQTNLTANINQIKTLLKKHLNHPPELFPIAETTPPTNEPENTCGETALSGGLSPIETLQLLFGLSAFEAQIIVLCAGQELDSEIKNLLAEIHGNPHMIYPTFGLALSCFPNAHWSATTPASPLRQFHLIETNPTPTTPITATPIRISERILHYLKGITYLDSQLQGIITPVHNNDQPVKSHLHLVNKILSLWNNNKEKLPVIHLCGTNETDKLAIAQTALTTKGLTLWQLPAELIPQKPHETTSLAQLWTREATLFNAGLLITTDDTTNDQTQKTTLRFIDQLCGPIFLTTKERYQTPPNNTLTLQVNKPLKTEQRQLWQTNIKHQDPNLPNIVSALVNQFNFSASTIKAATNQAAMRYTTGLSIKALLWESACIVSRPRFSELAQQITPKATLDSLVLPEREKQQIREIIAHVAQRHKVYEDWGFEDQNSRGLGISALFSGSSGTGKTMTAEVIAHELHLDIFRIDLSAVVSKYIGETEKNLSKLFDAAEDTGAILFFDEADALFGKRTEIKDSHDRHANIEINYLLQRMENYRGLAILATNMRDALDPAFVRRLKFIINFPFPDEKSRLEIWQNIFPKKTPFDNLNFTQLAKLNIAGGNIQNIALYSAFLAANENTPITMQHIKRAAQVEYIKMEKPLTGNWHHENQH
ncbi:MAG: ATP-binding protein [Nitrososphaerota archaeon]|jgi:AAA+ superfamily predicted ATPase|nr:ATP-binding protein [Nitrososphaerota archaeon]